MKHFFKPKKIFFLALITIVVAGSAYTFNKDVENELTPEMRARQLVSQMTLQEKVSQMKYDAPAIERLNVPAYNWWNECLHGVGRAGEATVFPQAIGMGASWDTTLIFEAATAISDEARAKHHRFIKEGKRGIYQGLTFWTPNINIFRDPRWGRGQETYGEDPFLTSRIGVNFINGLQGDRDDYLKVVATAKHFAVHSGPEKSRHEDNYITTDKDLHETYLPAFEAAIIEANVASVMCAYNRHNDQACCGSNLLLDSILRQDWAFDGYVVSDCWAINDFYFPNRHGVSSDGKEASALAVKTGTDLNCGNTYDPHLAEAVLEKIIDEEELDIALTRLFTARFKLGMFDDEKEVFWAQIPYDVVTSEKHYALSEQMSKESMVLLKNENKHLPLSKDLKKVAVIGPNAHSKQALLGNYHGTPKTYITPLEAIKTKLPNAEVVYERGTEIAEGWPLLTPIPAENLNCKGQKGLKGSYFTNDNWNGEPAFVRQDEIVDFVWIERPIEGHLSDTMTVRWEGEIVAPKAGSYRIGLRACNSGKLHLNGEQVFEFSDDHQPQMKYYDMNLKEGEKVAVQVDYYNFHADPQVQLLWGRMDEDLLAPAVKAAKEADAVILCLGLSPDIEGEEMPVLLEGFDKGDRSDIRLPKPQRELLQEIMKTGKSVTLVLMNGSALAVNYAAENVPAILEAWYPGQFGGKAIADVLFGDYNPAGRLPVTFYKSVDDLPHFKSYDMTNRTYKYFKGEPLFPFGHGLSYTTFKYSELNLPKMLEAGKKVNVSVDVTNTGDYDGDEVVQLYVSMPDAELAPIRSLIGFDRIHLKKGETKRVTFNLKPEQLKVITLGGNKINYKGTVQFSVGGKQAGFEGVADASSTEVITANLKMK
ncbi:glycoside hydrolase family 3 protein [Sediminitomix flava]|uniref:Beta-glucosidase n=1 Tax=Sediminitomix flava TaxID=379075 RepID=A0A315Z8L0_SEDFL|nr:glycoside hydrolase family 3 protein [Sediminitomix flava]PWJ41905.1 beta-glucosidase [Sediminitomix flava]